jgi:DNA-binding response OmpR family regulator
MKLGQTQLSAQIRDVLVVDADAGTAEAIKSELGTSVQNLRVAGSADQAVMEMKRRPADVLMINIQIGDQSGLELVSKWRRAYPNIEVIALSRSQRSDVCLAAWRAGASDMLFQPLDRAAVRTCLSHVLERRAEKERLTKRNQRLRQTCRQLSKARKEIGAQVDLLCHDLVKAYQDIAQQLHTTQTSGEFATTLGQDLDIETMMRATMQYILKKAGPVNAAVFLPDSEGNYVLGAYLDLDTKAETMLVEVIAQTLVPHAVAAKDFIDFTDDTTIHAKFAQPMLHGRSWLAVATYHKSEPMAVLVAFRGQDEAMPPTVRATMESIAAVLGGRISRLVDIHNRTHDLHDTPDNEDGSSPTA